MYEIRTGRYEIFKHLKQKMQFGVTGSGAGEGAILRRTLQGSVFQ